ncbi:MAG: heavy metal efflux pump [Verrucomicrobiaceae bacterium]|nr:heavy metal efflux pump [Verrucomicrobiaceae bacterium]
MLSRLVSFALEQRNFVIAAVIAVMIGGIYALVNLPIEAFPDVQDVQVQIITQAPGLAPEEIERSISLPIEREMNGVPHMTQLRSVSIFGLSVVTLTFEDNTDDYFARQQVMEKLQNVALPLGIQPGLAPLTTAVGEIYRYILEAPAGTTLEKIRELQDWVVRPALRAIPGVADVASFGGAVKEYQVSIDPQLMRKYDVNLAQINAALSSGSANTGGGILRRGDEALVVRSIGLFHTEDDIGQVAVSTQNGKAILIRDIATIAIGQRARSGIVSYNDQDDVVEGVVQMTKAQNPSAVIAALKAAIPGIEQRLPSGYHLLPIYDRTELVNHTVRTVEENMLMGAFLVLVILIVFLRSPIAAVIVAAVIPLALLFAFLLMHLRGVSANLISLGAVDFGIIVDGAVVLVEALMVRLALDKTLGPPSHDTPRWRMNALRSTAVEMGHPILFAKAIIILAFLPIFTFQRVEGKIFSPMTYTLSFAILGAILLTLTLIPALLSFVIIRFDFSEKHSPWMSRLQRGYREFLIARMQRDTIWIILSVGLLGLALLLGTRLGTEFLPKLDEGNIWLSINLPQATNLEKSREVEHAIRAILRSYSEVSDVISQVGRPDDGTDAKGPNNMEILADLRPHREWRFANKDDLIADMTQKIHRIPGVPTNFSQVIEDNVEESISGVKGEIAVKIFGPDLDVLEEKSRQVATIISGIRGATDVEAIKVGGQSELDIEINREKIARYGIDIGAVNSAIQTALAGSTVNNFYEGDRQFAVTVRLREEARDAIDDIAEIPIALSGTGTGTLPLGELASISVRQGAARIGRESGERNVSVKANLLGRDQGSFVAEAMRTVAAQVHLPPDYTMTWGGQFENQQRAMHRLAVIVPLSVVGIFILSFMAFRSMRLAALVLVLIPFTWIGGLAGLALAGLHLSISAAVGFIAVAGISVQNGVIMVEQFADGIKQGKTLIDAVLDGATIRLRPILMTALMAGLGLLPAALSHSIGSETQRPFAVVIVGGLITATAFTLLLAPLLFMRWFSKEKATL